MRGGCFSRAWRVGLAALALLAATDAMAEIALTQRQSPYDAMSPQVRAMQDDDSANPAMFWVLDGQTAWSERVGAAKKSCADCHGDASKSMAGVAARYPVFDAARNKVIDIEDRINICRSERQGGAALPRESKELLALTSFIARQSKGAPIKVSSDAASMRAVEQGRELFSRRQGQLNLSCANCHEDNWGRKLAGAAIPQGHPTGYPVYRLEWQTLGSLQRRLRNCMSGMRAQAYDYGSDEFAALEMYLMWRARDMQVDAPGVRP